MVRPKPVPPNFLVAELSSGENALKILFYLVMIPVSITAKRILAPLSNSLRSH
jgi:hypothetical protein